MPELFAPLTSDAPLGELAAELAREFARVGFHSDGIAGHIGPEALDALYRGEPAAVFNATKQGEVLDILIRAFILHEPTSAETLALALPARLVTGLVDAGIALADATGRLTIALDIRPHIISGRNAVVFSDTDATFVDHVPGPDHVLGVGSASLSLLQSTPVTPVESVLDLGTGSGVQLLGQWAAARTITATDIHPRALTLAEATVSAARALSPEEAAGPADVELLQGSWFEPVAGRTFDRIVANPPFVVGLPEVGLVYRDSGLNLDGATELVLDNIPEHLNVGGTAHVLGAWVHVGDESWEQRVASWLPEKGVCAWIIQRDVADPALYVSTWLKDESVDIRSAHGRERAQLWLDHFDKHDVIGVGFGFIAIERLDDDEPSDVMAEYMPQSFSDPLGPEVEEYFARARWLRNLVPGEFESHRFGLRAGLAKEVISLADAAPGAEVGCGFAPAVLRLTRTEGPRWSHEVDEHIAAIVGGLNPAGLNLEETVYLYAAAHDFDPDALLTAVIPVMVDLVRHGLVIPDALNPQTLLDGQFGLADDAREEDR